MMMLLGGVWGRYASMYAVHICRSMSSRNDMRCVAHDERANITSKERASIDSRTAPGRRRLCCKSVICFLSSSGSQPGRLDSITANAHYRCAQTQTRAKPRTNTLLHQAEKQPPSADLTHRLHGMRRHMNTTRWWFRPWRRVAVASLVPIIIGPLCRRANEVWR